MALLARFRLSGGDTYKWVPACSQGCEHWVSRRKTEALETHSLTLGGAGCFLTSGRGAHLWGQLAAFPAVMTFPGIHFPLFANKLLFFIRLLL